MIARGWLRLFLGIAGGAVVVAALGLVSIEPGEVGVVRRFGRVLDPVWQPGLHWRLPFGIDRLDRVRPAEVRSLEIGHKREAGLEGELGSGEVLSGDLNLLNIASTVQYRAARPAAYVVRAEQVEMILTRLFESAASRAIAHTAVDEALRGGRGAIAREVEQTLAAEVSRLRLGVEILSVGFSDMRPPIEVEADFAAAQSAESERDSRIALAHGQADAQLTRAKAESIAIGERASAQALGLVRQAQARADRFAVLERETRSSRVLAERRLYIEALRSILQRVKTRLLLPGDDALDMTILGTPG